MPQLLCARQLLLLEYRVIGTASSLPEKLTGRWGIWRWEVARAAREWRQVQGGRRGFCRSDWAGGGSQPSRASQQGDSRHQGRERQIQYLEQLRAGALALLPHFLFVVTIMETWVLGISPQVCSRAWSEQLRKVGDADLRAPHEAPPR